MKKPLQADIANLLVLLSEVTHRVHQLTELVAARETRVSEAIMELQKDAPNKAKVLELLS